MPFLLPIAAFFRSSWRWLAIIAATLPQFRHSLSLAMIGVKPILEFSGFASRSGFVQRAKTPQVDCFAAHSDGGLPSLPRPTDAHNAAGIVPGKATVPHVRSLVRRSQIGQAVIASVAINVVNRFRRVSVNNRPDKPMSAVASVANADVCISIPRSPRRLACIATIPRLAYVSARLHECFWRPFLPIKEARFRLVAQQLTEIIRRGYRVLSHRALPRSFWSGPGVVEATIPARSFLSESLFVRNRGGGFASCG